MKLFKAKFLSILFILILLPPIFPRLKFRLKCSIEDVHLMLQSITFEDDAVTVGRVNIVFLDVTKVHLRSKLKLKLSQGGYSTWLNTLLRLCDTIVSVHSIHLHL